MCVRVPLWVSLCVRVHAMQNSHRLRFACKHNQDYIKCPCISYINIYLFPRKIRTGICKSWHHTIYSICRDNKQGNILGPWQHASHSACCSCLLLESGDILTQENMGYLIITGKTVHTLSDKSVCNMISNGLHWPWGFPDGRNKCSYFLI